jgi:hypothetical protein
MPQMIFSPHWYDLDALFRKEFGNFTVNVQALSRVSLDSLKQSQHYHDNYRISILTVKSDMGNSANMLLTG